MTDKERADFQGELDEAVERSRVMAPHFADAMAAYNHFLNLKGMPAELRGPILSAVADRWFLRNA